MAPLLRKVRHNRWYAALSSRGQPLPADPVGDLGTTDNSLAVWQVLTNDTNLEDIVVAIAATLDYLTNIDVVLVDEQPIRHLGIKVEPTQGRTPLRRATGYHRHLVQLRAQTLLEIAEVIRNQGDFRDFSEKEVRQLLARYISEGSLNPSELKDRVKEHLESRNLIPPTPGA